MPANPQIAAADSSIPTPNIALVIPARSTIPPHAPSRGCVYGEDYKHESSSTFDCPVPDPVNRSAQQTKDAYYAIYNGPNDDGTFDWIGTPDATPAMKVNSRSGSKCSTRITTAASLTRPIHSE